MYSPNFASWVQDKIWLGTGVSDLSAWLQDKMGVRKTHVQC